MSKWEPRTAGFTDTLSNADYHAAKWAVSSTYLKATLNACQAAAEASEHKDAPALRIGSALHALVLEGRDALNRDFAVMPDGMSRRTKAGKEWSAEREAEGRAVLTQAEADTVIACDRAIRYECPTFAKSLGAAPIRERSIFWQDQASGVWCRARPDAYGLTEDGGTLIDLKTCADLGRFERQVFESGYDVQLDFYMRGLYATHRDSVHADAFDNVRVGILAVETSPPYRTGLYWLSTELLADADLLVDGLLWRVACSGRFVSNVSDAHKAAYGELPAFGGHEEMELSGAPGFVASQRRAWLERLEEDKLAVFSRVVLRR